MKNFKKNTWRSKLNKKRSARAVYGVEAKERSTGTERIFFLDDPDDTDLEWFVIDNNLRDVKYNIHKVKF